jgi:hypothetical protein
MQTSNPPTQPGEFFFGFAARGAMLTVRLRCALVNVFARKAYIGGARFTVLLRNSEVAGTSVRFYFAALAAGSFLSRKELLRSRAAGSPGDRSRAWLRPGVCVARQLRMTTFL